MSIRFRKRRDGSTYTQVRFRNNQRETSVSFDDHAEAIKFQSLLDQVGPDKALEISRIVAAPHRETTVRSWLTKHNDSLTGVDAGTLKRYCAYVRNDIGPVLGELPLAVLSRDDVAGWLNAMAEAGASGKTIKNKRDYLASALRAAVKAGHMKANPCEDVRAPRWDRGEMTFLTHDEFQLLLSEIPHYWKPLVEFLVASGCRWSEATALKPGAVDRTNGTVRVTKAWKLGNRLGVPKTKKSVRTIDIGSRLLDKLDYTGEWLFTNSGRGNVNPDGHVQLPSFHANVWRPALARAKAKGLTKTPRIHDLRHTCASWLIQAGVSLPVVQRHLGHESINTTIDTYTHLDRSSSKLAADAISDMLS